MKTHEKEIRVFQQTFKVSSTPKQNFPVSWEISSKYLPMQKKEGIRNTTREFNFSEYHYAWNLIALIWIRPIFKFHTFKGMQVRPHPL